MIELECQVRAGDWAGVSRAYSRRPQLASFVCDLKEFADRSDGTAMLEAGGDVSGFISLKFYAYDKAKHIGCFVQLGSPVPTDHRLEEISCLSMEVQTETSFLESFIRDLGKVADGLNKEAVLRIRPLT